MKVKAKKLLSLALALVMVLGIFPVTGFAANEAGIFADVPASAWFSEAVQYVSDNNLMVGVGDNRFEPDGLTTRGMVVTVLYRMEGEPSAEGTGFTDVEDGMWYADAILWAQANGIVEGYGDGTFHPNASITREEMVVMFYRYSDYKGYNITNREDMGDFEDGSTVLPYAEEAMSWAISVGLIKGFPDGTIRPKEGSNRAQLAAVLMRFHRTFPIPIYIIRYDSCGGSAVPSQAVYEGERAYRPADPTREGCVFEDWYRDEALTELYDFGQPVYSDIMLYAKWISLDVRIELDAGDYDENIVTRTVTGYIEHNIAIEGITWELTGSNKTESGEIALEDSSGFSVDVMLEDGENVFTVTVATADGSEASNSICMTFDSGYVYDSGEVYDETDDRLILIPRWYTEDTSGEPDEYLVANILSLYFYDHTTFDERKTFIEDTLGGEMVGYLNSLDMMQILLPNPLTNAAEVGYTGETELTCVTEDELWAYGEALTATYGNVLESADPEYIYNNMECAIVTNDPWDGNASDDWWLDEIEAYDAWGYDNYYNSDFLRNITLGVVDTGVRTTHTELAGLVRPIGPSNVVDNHGTHVTGIVGANADNAVGLAGVIYDNATEILTYDVFKGGGGTSSSLMLEALTKQVESGAKVINFSIGSSGSIAALSTSVSAASIEKAGKTSSKHMGKLLGKGYDFIVVQSAGNGNSAGRGVNYWNNGTFCAINKSNCYSSSKVTKAEIMGRIVIVAATNPDDKLTRFSNGGIGELNIIAAPGENIFSTVAPVPFTVDGITFANYNEYYTAIDRPDLVTNDATYAYLSGTSMAAPMVTAVCGMTWSVNRGLTGAEVVDLVMDNTEGIAATNGGSYTPGGMGIVNARKAVTAAIQTRPTYCATIVDALSGDPISSVSVVVHKDGPTGPVVGKEQVYYTDDSGVFTLPKLPANLYWLEVTAEGYVPGLFYMNGWSNKNATIHMGTVALTPEMDDSEYRIILRWTGEPRDLDSHLTANLVDSDAYYHVWYADMAPYPAYANLDLDDTFYEGPETVTITHFKELKNIRYAVHDYTNRDSSSSKVLSNSGATVEVYKGSKQIAKFSVPKNTGGTEWDVFAIDAEGNIIPINQMKYNSDPEYVLCSDVDRGMVEMEPAYLVKKEESE